MIFIPQNSVHIQFSFNAEFLFIVMLSFMSIVPAFSLYFFLVCQATFICLRFSFFFGQFLPASVSRHFGFVAFSLLFRVRYLALRFPLSFQSYIYYILRFIIFFSAFHQVVVPFLSSMASAPVFYDSILEFKYFSCFHIFLSIPTRIFVLFYVLPCFTLVFFLLSGFVLCFFLGVCSSLFTMVFLTWNTSVDLTFSCKFPVVYLSYVTFSFMFFLVFIKWLCPFFSFLLSILLFYNSIQDFKYFSSFLVSIFLYHCFYCFSLLYLFIFLVSQPASHLTSFSFIFFHYLYLHYFFHSFYYFFL